MTSLRRRNPWFGSLELPTLDLPDLRLEEYREEGDLVIRAELPGIDPEKDVEITVLDHTLRIAAERHQRIERDDDGYRSEFTYGSLQRVLRLPAGADESDVHASYTDGILEIRVPVGDEEATGARKVPISRA